MVTSVPTTPGVYRIVRLASGDCYVGSTKNLRRRRNEHFRWLRAQKHHSRHLQHAWNLYGEAEFRFEVLEHCEATDRHQREQHYMDLMQPAYNILREAGEMPKGGGSAAAREAVRRHATGNTYRLGKSHTEETRQLLRERSTGRTASDSTRKKMSLAHQGHAVSPATISALKQRNSAREWTQADRDNLAAKARARMTDTARQHLSALNKGKTHSEESRRKMSEARKGIVPSQETRDKRAESMKKAWERRKERKNDGHAPPPED